MRGRRWGLAWGAALLAFLLVAPPGLSVTGSGVVATQLPVQLWGPLHAELPGGGLAVQGGAYDGGLRLDRGRVTLTTLELALGPLGGLRRTSEVLAAGDALLELYPTPDAQLFGYGRGVLDTAREARLVLPPEGDAFLLEHGGQALAFAFPPRNAVVQAASGSAGLEGPMHLFLRDVAVRIRDASGVRDLRVGAETLVRVADEALPLSAPRPRDLGAAVVDNLDDLAGRAGATAGLGAPGAVVQEVLVQRYLEVEGAGQLVVRSHGALLQAFSRAPAVHLAGGAATLPGAVGDVSLLGAVVPLRGETAQLAGDLWLRAMPGDGAQREMAVGGTFQSFAVDGALVEPPLAGPAALALGALAAVGLASSVLKHLAGALYARIPPSDVLSSDVRRRVYQLVQAEPGLSLSELAQRAALSWGNTVHHLSVLKRSGLVVSLRHGRYRRWFAAGAVEQGQRGQVAALRNPVSARVARLVLEVPGLSQKQLADRMAMSPQAVHWHLARLAQAGLVQRVREGREVRHYVAAAPPAVAMPATVTPATVTPAAAGPGPALQPQPL